MGDFAFHMRFRRGNIREFFGHRPEDAAILDERQKWLDLNASACAGVVPTGETALEEAVELAGRLAIPIVQHRTPFETCVALGRVWAPDFLILRASENDQPELVAGCVCFPSSWSFEEKLGRPLDFIHEPVPTLNAQFANPVRQFLARIKPGISWERINWGLSRSPELNQHPQRRLPRLDASIELGEVWFRLEYQSLVALPRTNGILFGIRLVMEPLSRLQEDPALAKGLARALETMPDAVASYKGLLVARPRLIAILRSGGRSKI